ncbi:PREDICTED: uncharacterized protein LOC109131201 [Camelina sativa]|uniref:S-protein homolog n=1 Tax=Camelina sativa TaxID=90675 RepID=A0ABM1REK2_CAMSA|nr:PREDICTED: uncharacterized protein LOC109131201 [Camelina sativa]
MGSLKELVAFIIIMCATSVTTMTLAQNAMAPAPAPPSADNPNTTVVLHNGGSVPMVFHCMSLEVDFKTRIMMPGGTWSFEFLPSVSGDTKYACSFAWRLKYHLFRIYWQSRDQVSGPHGCKRCEWKLRPEGPCQINEKTGKIDHCPPWDSQLF